MTTLGAYPTFKASDDFKVFTERLENAFFIKKTSPTDRAPILLSQIDADVYKRLRSLCDPEPPANKSFEDLCALLRCQYVQEMSVWKARQIFFRKRQAPNEGVNNWYLRLKEHAADCGFGETLDAAIRCKFVVGLESSVVFDKIAEQGSSLSLDELLAIAMSMEDEHQSKVKPNPRNFRRCGSSLENTLDEVDENKVVARGTNQNENQRNDRDNQRPFRQCWHCGETGGHKFSTCVHKNSTCNFCHELGHLQRMCRYLRSDERLEMGEKLAKVVDETKDIKQLLPVRIPEESKLCSDELLTMAMSMKDESQSKRDPNPRNSRRRERSVENTLDGADEKKVVARDTNQNERQNNDRGNHRPRQCWHCGETGGHQFSTCVHKNSYCNFCHGLGHLEKICRHVQLEVRSEIDEKSLLTSNIRSAQPPLTANVRTEQSTPAPNVRPPQAPSAQIVRPVQTSAAAPAMRNCPYCGGINHRFNTCGARQCRRCFKMGHLSHQCDSLVIENQPRQQQNSEKNDDKCCIC